MKEVLSRKGGTSMIKCKQKIFIYNIDYLEESVVHRLLSTAVSSFFVNRKEVLNE